MLGTTGAAFVAAAGVAATVDGGADVATGDAPATTGACVGGRVAATCGAVVTVGATSPPHAARIALLTTPDASARNCRRDVPRIRADCSGVICVIRASKGEIRTRELAGISLVYRKQGRVAVRSLSIGTTHKNAWEGNRRLHGHLKGCCITMPRDTDARFPLHLAPQGCSRGYPTPARLQPSSQPSPRSGYGQRRDNRVAGAHQAVR